VIESRNDIKDAIAQRIIWCFWTGDNEMSDQRRRCLDNMEQTTRCNVVLVTKAALDHFLCPDHPLHTAYQYLSETTKPTICGRISCTITEEGTRILRCKRGNGSNLSKRWK
jgi:hypothetical protein